MEFRISGLAYSIKCLNDTYPEKAHILIKQLDTQDIIDRSYTSTIVCISNALVELNTILPRYHLGTNIFNACDLEIISKKLDNARFEHIGKSLSEFRKVDPILTKKLYLNLNVNRISENAHKVSFKAIGKTLNELKIIEKEFDVTKYAKSKIILDSIPDKILLSKAEKVSLEGLGRALNELKNIDSSKMMSILNNIDNRIIIGGIEKNSLLQIGHTLSELRKINFRKVREIFFQCDSKLLAYKITEHGFSINQISYALYQFQKIDQNRIKLKEILSNIQTNYFIKKIKKVDFNKFCISLEYLNAVDRNLVQEVLNNIPFDIIYEKASKESFEILGTSVNKLFYINSNYAKLIVDKIDWISKLKSGPTIRFDKFGNSLNHLYIINNQKVVELYKSIDFDFILKIARTSSKSELNQGLNKLMILDHDLTNRIQTLIVT